MKVRKLNEYGLSEFDSFIKSCRKGVHKNIPLYLLDDVRTSQELDFSLEVKDQTFDSRYQMGLYLTSLLEGKNIQNLIGDQGFWSWFALLWFEQLCPVNKDGVRNPSKEYNYILSQNYNHRPRHAVYMTWQLVSRYGEDVKFMLSKSLSTRGELTEQMMARQEILTSEGVMRLASILYYDKETGIFKKGSASRKSPGCVSRYVSWLQQLQVTYDIFSMSENDLEKLLPAEFSRFKAT